MPVYNLSYLKSKISLNPPGFASPKEDMHCVNKQDIRSTV